MIHFTQESLLLEVITISRIDAKLFECWHGENGCKYFFNIEWKLFAEPVLLDDSERWTLLRYIVYCDILSYEAQQSVKFQDNFHPIKKKFIVWCSDAIIFILVLWKNSPTQNISFKYFKNHTKKNFKKIFISFLHFKIRHLTFVWW